MQVPLPHDLAPLGAKGWVASNVCQRQRSRAWTYQFAFGPDGYVLNVEAESHDGALLAMLERIQAVEKLMKPAQAKRVRA